MKGGDELSLKDLTFLRAIRDITESPERFSSTERGETPATVTAITEATTLTAAEVASRLDDPELEQFVEVYETERPEGDSGLDSAELTDSGEAAIDEADQQQRSVGDQEWRPEEATSEFSDVQEWEPADVENGATGTGANPGSTAADGGSVDSSGAGTTAGAVAESASTGTLTEPAALTTMEGRSSTTADGEEADVETDTTEVSRTVTVEKERLAALEARIEELETAQSSAVAAEDVQATNAEEMQETTAKGAPEPAIESESAVDPERVETLHEEVRTLQTTTEEMASTLEDVVSELEAIEDSEYGALNQKREEQFRTAVKSTVAFHQLAKQVLDVRVANYEPAAGRPDDERVEITRNRISDALGIGKSGGGTGGLELSAADGDDSHWPSPDEPAGGRVFAVDDESATDENGTAANEEPVADEDGPERSGDDEPDTESEAPETGVYPPLGADEAGDSQREGSEDDEAEPETESDAPDTGIYPPIGSSGDEEQNGDGAAGGEESSADETADEDEQAAADPGENESDEREATAGESASEPVEEEAEPADEKPETAYEDSNPAGKQLEAPVDGSNTTETDRPATLRDDDGTIGGTLSMDVEERAVTENIRAAASEGGHVMKPIRSTGEGSGEPEAGGESPVNLPAAEIDAVSVQSVRAAVVAARGEDDTEPQADARIAEGEKPVEALAVRHPEVSDVPAVPSDASRRFAMAPADGDSAGPSSDDPGVDGTGDD